MRVTVNVRVVPSARLSLSSAPEPEAVSAVGSRTTHLPGPAQEPVVDGIPAASRVTCGVGWATPASSVADTADTASPGGGRIGVVGGRTGVVGTGVVMTGGVGRGALVAGGVGFVDDAAGAGSV